MQFCFEPNVELVSPHKWFGFLKTGQAKETETLQESVLYKEVSLQMQVPVGLSI